MLNERELNEISGPYRELVQQARDARNNSYSPYSGFAVGAAVMLETGEVFSGSNQENAAYPSGLCAERTALFFAKHQHPKKRVEAIAVTVDERSRHLPFPCGSCLQVISEFEAQQKDPIQILLVHPQQNKLWQANGVKNLMPFAFGKENLSR